MAAEENYEQGRKHGRWTKWYRNGNLMREDNYLDGRKHGRFAYWRENGMKWQEFNYLHGELHGASEIYYDNGILMESGLFVEGKRHGKFSYWNRDGSVVRVIWYDMGWDGKMTEDTFKTAYPEFHRIHFDTPARTHK